MNTGSRKDRKKGSEVLEFGLVLIPVLGFVFLIIDLSWAVFARSSLQHAVREGVRYGVTSQYEESLGHLGSVRQVVQSRAMGLLAGTDGAEKIKIRFFDPDTLADVSDQPDANAGGNLIEVSVEGVSWRPLMPLLRDRGPWSMTARSADRMEATPPTGRPPL